MSFIHSEWALQPVENLLKKLSSEDIDEKTVTTYCDKIDEISKSLTESDDKDELMFLITECPKTLGVITANRLKVKQEFDETSLIVDIIANRDKEDITKLLKHGLFANYCNDVQSLKNCISYLTFAYGNDFIYRDDTNNADNIFNAELIISELPKIMQVVKSNYSTKLGVIKGFIILVNTLTKNPIASCRDFILKKDMLDDLSVAVGACYDTCHSINEVESDIVIHLQMSFLLSLKPKTVLCGETEFGIELRLTLSSAVNILLPSWHNRVCRISKSEVRLKDADLSNIIFLTWQAVRILEGDGLRGFSAVKELVRDGWFVTLMNLHKMYECKDMEYMIADFTEIIFNHSPNSTVQEQCWLIPYLIPIIEYKGIPQGQLTFRPSAKTKEADNMRMYLVRESASYMTISEAAIDFAINVSQIKDPGDSENLMKAIRESKILDVIVEFAEFNFSDSRYVQRTLIWFSTYAKWAGPEGVPIALTTRIVTKIVELIRSSTGGKKSKKNLEKYDLTVELPQILMKLLTSLRKKSSMRVMNKEHGMVGIVLRFLATNKDPVILSEFIGHFLYQFHLLVGFSDDDCNNLVKDLPHIHECMRKSKRQLKGDVFKKFCLLVISEFPLHSKPDSTTFKPLQDIVIELIEQSKFTAQLPLNAINVLWALTRWENCDLLNGFLLNFVKTGDCERKAERLKRLSKPEKDSIYTFLVNEAIKRIDSEDLADVRDLKCFTSKLLEITNSGLSDNELYILEDLISPLMWMTSRVENKNVIKNVKSFIDILH